MDIDLLRGLITFTLLVLFIGICLWAWSSKRKQAFSEAANLPLLDDNESLIPSEPHSQGEKR